MARYSIMHRTDGEQELNTKCCTMAYNVSKYA